MEKQCFAEVIENKPIAQKTYLLTVRVTDEMVRLFVPGQFAHIKVPHSDSRLLRRPISIHAVEESEATMQFAYLVQGEGTQRIAASVPGDALDILAPLGNGFAIRPEHKKIWLVGGGIGIAPLYSLKNAYPDRSYRAFLGYKSSEYIYETERFEAFCASTAILTDDGSAGEKGFVTDALARALEKEKPDVILACGPTPMFRSLRAVWEKCGRVETQISMEQHMGCGVGGCYTCTCGVGGKMKRVCVDGPVFDIGEVEL